MTENLQNSIRKYLLGKLDDETESRLIEEKILLDDEFAETVAAAEDELIEDYLDGLLNAEEAEKFAARFLVSPERRRRLNFICDLKEYSAQAAESAASAKKTKSSGFDLKKLFSLPAFRFAVVALLFAAIGFGVWRTVFYQSDVDRGLAQLRQAYRGQRPIEPRTSANFEYAPLPNTRGASGAENLSDEKSRDRAERLLHDAAENSADAAAHQALGLLYLSKREIDKALSEFNLALKLKPDDAKILSDAGAAYLEKAKLAETEEKGEEFFQNADAALRNINRALEINPNLLDAMFNRALVLQKMNLTNEARAAWQKYLEKDSVSPWADEARRNLELLKQQTSAPKSREQILQDFLETFRSRNEMRAHEIVSQTKEPATGIMISQQLAGKFLELENEPSRKEEQTEILSAFLYLGEIEKQKTGDPYFAELAEYYAKTDSARRRKLSAAQTELQKGFELMLKANFTAGLKVFQSAEKMFAEAGNKWEEKSSEHFAAYCLYNTDRLDEAIRSWSSAEIFSGAKNYRWLQYTNLYWLAGAQDILEQYTKSKKSYEKGLAMAEAADDSFAVQRFRLALAAQNRRLGQKRAALEYSRKIMAKSDDFGMSRRQKWRNLSDILEILASAEYFALAEAVAAENIFLADEMGDSLFIADARIDAGIVGYKKGDFDAARSRLTEVEHRAQNVGEEVSRNFLTGRAALNLAHLERKAGNYELSTRLYDRTFGIFEKLDIAAYRYEVQKGRLLSYMELGNQIDLEKQIPLTLEIAEKYRREISDEQQRDGFFDSEQTVYDIAVDYEYRNKRFEKAYSYAENANSRSLLDWLSKGAKVSYRHNKQVEILLEEPVEPLNLAEIRAEMPDRAQILQYTVLEKKVLIWLVSKEKFIVVETPIQDRDLRAKIENYLNLITAPSAANRQNEAVNSARELYQLLIAPIAAHLNPEREICLIPSKFLFHLPFAALLSPAGKPLLNDFRIFYAPSANVFLRCTENAAKKENLQTETLLSVGNPAFDRREFSELANLPTAESEAREIGSLYPKAKILLGKNATKRAILNSLENADVIHFAGHYVVEPQSPLASKLVLAKNGALAGDEGFLTNAELIGRNLSRARLVLLSACQTGVESYRNGEGLIGLSRTFLAAGAPAIVASHWKVDSDAAAELMKNFHRFRRQEGFSTAESLRRAQLAMLASPNQKYHSPYYWAAFAQFGGYVRY
jgi:CHAT domain-containing protein/tetratricopeptide (TPR) repeat protein